MSAFDKNGPKRQPPALRFKAPLADHGGPRSHIPLPRPLPPSSRSPFGRRLPAIIGLLAFLLITSAALAFFNLGTADVDAFWHRARTALDQLHALPEDPDALRDLDHCIDTLAKANTPETQLVGLFSVSALAKLLTGRTDDGERMLAVVRQRHPDSPYILLLSLKNTEIACAICNGSGHLSCARCKGTGECSFCHGTGTAPGLAGPHPHPSGTPRRLGDAPVSTGPRETKGTTLTCPACNASGNCRACGGSKFGNDPCPTCHGSGKQNGPVILDEAFTRVLDRARKETNSHLRFAKLRSALRPIQQAMRERLPGFLQARLDAFDATDNQNGN